MAIVVNGPGTPGPQGPQGPTGPSGVLSANTGISIGGTLEMSGHIVPTATNTYNLGSTTAYFQDLYIGTGSIIMMSSDGKSAKLSMAADGELEFKRQTRLSLSANSGKKTKFTESATGDQGTTGATGCGHLRNYKFGGITEDAQGFYTKGKFWTLDNGNDSGCTFMNFDSIVINNWEDAPCDRNFTYQMNGLPYCARIDIFPLGFSGANQAWARFFYAGHYGVGGATQSGGISAGYHRFDIDTNHPIHTMNSSSGGSASFTVGDEYEIMFYPMCSEDSDTDDGASGGSGGSSGGSDGGGGTVDPPATTYPCIRRRGMQDYQGFTLENSIGSLEGHYALGGSGASGGITGSNGVVNINTISEMYVNNFALQSEGYVNDNSFLSSLNQTGRVTITSNQGSCGAAVDWVRYNYSTHAVSGGTGDGGYVRFTGMTLDAYGPDGPWGATATAVYEIDRLSNLCFEDSVGATCNPGEYTFTFRGITSSGPSNSGFKNSVVTGDMWFYDSTYDAGATFGQIRSTTIDRYEGTPCNRDLKTDYPFEGYNCNIKIFPEDFSGSTSDTWVNFWISSIVPNAGTDTQYTCNVDMQAYISGNGVRAYNGPSGGTAMLEVGKRYVVSFHPETYEHEDTDGGSGGATQNPPPPAWPSTYRYGATQGATAMRDPGHGYFGVSGASVGYTTLGGGATVADIRYINGFYVDTYSPDGDGTRYDGDFFDSLSQTGQLTLTRSNGGTAELWAKYNYTYHAGTGGTGGYRIFSGMTLAGWGPSGGFTSGSYGDFQIPLERSNSGVVPWNMNFQDVAGYTCEDNKYVFTFRGITNSSRTDTPFTNSIGTGDLWFYDPTYDAGATFGQMWDVMFDRWEDSPCNRIMGYGTVPNWSGGNVRLYPEDYNGLTSDTWVQYYYHNRTFIGNQEDGAWDFILDNYPNSAVRAFNGPSGGTAMLEVGKRYHVSFHPETNEGEDNDGGSGGSTAHPEAPAYPCTYRYGATQGATAYRDPGNGFFGVSGASVGFTTLGGGATVADIRYINEMFIDTYAPNGDGARYDGDFLEGLEQTGKITLTRMSGATSEVWARFSYDTHGNSLGSGGFHHFQGVTLDTWGPSGGYTSGSYGDYAIPMERTNVGVVPWKMMFENTAVTGPTASLGSNQFSFHYKEGTADSDPGVGFFLLGTTGAEDSLRDTEFLYIDNFEENGEYGTGRYIGDFMDSLDNSGTVTISPFGMTSGQQWIRYFYTTYVQGITSSGGSGGYHKVLGLSAESYGNWSGSSFGSGIQLGYATGPFMIEFNDSVAQTEWEYINIQGPRDFAETGLAYSVLEKGYPVTIESMRGRLGTGGGCTGTFYRNAMHSNPVPGISGVAFRNGVYNWHHASTAGNTFSGGNTLAADETLFLNLTGFTLAGSTGNPNYFSGYIQFRRTDGS